MNIKGTVAQALSLNVLIWLTMLTLFAGLLTCAAAGYLALVDVFSPALAALITGAGLIVVFMLLALLTRSAVSSPQPKPEKSEPQVDNALEHNLRPLIGNRATDWTRDNTGFAIVGALAAGTIIAASPQARRFMVRAVGPIFTRKVIRAVQDFSEDR